MQPNDLDIFEDDDDDVQPGPGSYYNPHAMSSFKHNKVPERLQFFGSTVDRFGNTKPSTADSSNLGPGHYTVSNLVQHQAKKANPQVFSGFNCTEQRFTDNQYKDFTPGPGSYEYNKTKGPITTVAAKKQCVFGSTSRRF